MFYSDREVFRRPDSELAEPCAERTELSGQLDHRNWNALVLTEFGMRMERDFSQSWHMN